MSTNVLTIDNMIGQSFKYRGRTHKILSHKTEGEETIIVTDQNWFEFNSRDELAYFVQDCSPVQEVETLESIKSKDAYNLVKANSNSDDVMAQLKGILLENIKNVKENKDFIPQAETVSKSVQTLINLTKLEVQLRRKVE